MFSLRKRAKLEQEKLFKRDNFLSFLTAFEELPVEVFYHILEFLSIREILGLRLLSILFKSRIDNAKHIWSRIVLRYEVDDSELFWNLLNTKLNLNSIKLENDYVIKNKRYKKELDISIANQASDLYKVSIERIHLESLCILNLFAKNCQTIDLKNFHDSDNIVKSSKQMEYLNREVDTFEQLKSASLNFKSFRESSQCELFVQTHFCSMLKKVLKLDLKSYPGSGKILIKSLRKLKQLEELRISNFFNNDEDQVRKQLSIRKLKIQSCSFKSTFIFLSSVCQNEIIQLDLFINSNCNHTYNIVERDKVLEQIKKFINLKKFRTNFFYMSKSNLFHFPRSLNELDLIDQPYNEDWFNVDVVKERFSVSYDDYCDYLLFDFDSLVHFFEQCIYIPHFENLKVIFKFDCSSLKKWFHFFSILQEKISFKYMYMIFKCTNHDCLSIGNSSCCSFDKLLTRRGPNQKINSYITLRDFFLKKLGINYSLSYNNVSSFIKTDYIQTICF